MFDFDVYKEIRADQKGIIDVVLNDSMQRYLQDKNIKFVIRGHACDSAGSEKYNMQLSDKRARTIRKRLEKIGINKKNISSFGCGTAEIINHGNKEEQAINRRAEIYIIN
jgi:outer membrane protein OmpA-like peptidoglycan-associated protein